jgi:hypothetical protein
MVDPLFKRRWAIAVPFVLALASVMGMFPAHATSFDDYYKECVQRSRREGLTQSVAQEVCTCTLKKFRSLYSLSQFQAIVKKSKTDKATARRLAEVGEACFEAILYED